MIRQLIIFILWCYSGSCLAQTTSVAIDKWIETLPYDNPVKSDSILYWADLIEQESEKIEYQRGVNYAQRFRAYYYHFEGDVAKATELYLIFLNDSKRINHLQDEMSAISDLVYTYISIGQLDKAKPLLLETIKNTNDDEVNPKQLSSFYNNLGIVYRQSQEIDSAAWAYNQSLRIKEAIGDQKGLVSLRINLSSLYTKLGKYQEAIQLAERNLTYLGVDGNPSDIIYNLINRAAGLFELGELGLAEKNALKAVTLADSIGDINLQQLSINSLSSVYQKSGQYEKAYNNLLLSQEIKSQIFDEQSNVKITELRELYEAERREQDNKYLSTEVAAQKIRLRSYTVGILGLLALLGTLTWFWKSNQSKNRLLEKQNNKIQKQNEKLVSLNASKNNLMSMVSHDLSTPFSTIKIWAQGISADAASDDFKETKEAIISMSDQALKAIDSILTIDDKEVYKVDLSEIVVRELIKDVVSRHQDIAGDKNIRISSSTEPEDLRILTDIAMLSRILDNLTSNAIKYTNPNGSVSLSTHQDEDTVLLKVEDDGIGISIQDQKVLFERYTTGSIKPSQGESSHGLGLAIVKRLVDELGGVIRVKSKVGEGSIFTVRLPL